MKAKTILKRLMPLFALLGIVALLFVTPFGQGILHQDRLYMVAPSCPSQERLSLEWNMATLRVKLQSVGYDTQPTVLGHITISTEPVLIVQWGNSSVNVSASSIYDPNATIYDGDWKWRSNIWGEYFYENVLSPSSRPHYPTPFDLMGATANFPIPEDTDVFVVISSGSYTEVATFHSPFVSTSAIDGDPNSGQYSVPLTAHHLVTVSTSHFTVEIGLMPAEICVGGQ